MPPASLYELIADRYGTDASSQALRRVATVPLNLTVVISAEVEIIHPAQTLNHFEQGNCIGMHRACLWSNPPNPRLSRETAAYGPLASTSPCICCIRKG